MAAQDTSVSFASGETTGESIVRTVRSHQDGAIVVTDATPFHPIDHTWPDQPGDAGTIGSGDESADVVEAVMIAESEDGALFVGAEIPVKRGVEGWAWQVGHQLSAPDAPDWLRPGVEVSLSADAELRAALSRGHTSCHLASLALDLAVADLWRKEPGTDALGNPDFEGRANQTSRIHKDGAVDEYRLGKSLRRAGFDTAEFAASLSEREQRINAQLAAWVATGAPSRIVTDGPTIVDMRRWECELPEGTASIPCGGTHVHALSEFAAISVSLDLSDPQLLMMTTVATPAD